MKNLPALPATDPQRPTAPAEVEAAVVQSLTSALGLTPSFQTRTTHPAGEPPKIELIAVRFDKPLTGATDGGLAVTAEVIERSFAPAGRRDLLKAVAILGVRCKRRESSDADTRLAVEVLVQDLAELPADAAVWALDEWSRRSPWWPTRAELLALGRSAMQQRIALRHHVRREIERRSGEQ